MGAAEAYPNLLQFLGGHLHQDFDLDFESADEAIQQAIVGSSADCRHAVAREIDALLASHRDEDSLAAGVGELCDYHPPGDGLTYRQWLLNVRARLEGLD